jgi:NTP pyrophosphatase (non-canonical NTP hydrolase)
MTKSLNELRDEAFRIAREHGFKDASIPEDVALMHSELSELLEDFRAGRLAHETYYENKRVPNPEGEKTCEVHHYNMGDGHCSCFRDDKKPCGIPSELADVVIRVLHFSGKHGVDIEKAVIEKMAYNNTRPFKHGGKVL